MNFKNSIFIVFCAIGFISMDANAAVVCVFNKASQTFEPKGGIEKGKQNECALPATENPFTESEVAQVKKDEANQTVAAQVISEKASAGIATIDVRSDSVNLGISKNLWVATSSDKNFRMLLTRWGQQSTPKWEVIWRVGRDIPLNGHFAEHFEDFKDAADFLSDLADSQAGIAIHPCFHTNNVVRIVPRTLSCKPLSQGQQQ